MRASNRNKKLQRNKLALGGLIAVAILLIAAGAYIWSTNHKPTSIQPSPSVTPTNQGNSVIDEPTVTPAPAAPPQPTGAAMPAPAKPMLQKSSGNAPGSSVPAKALIEFTCEGTPGASCDIVLTDTKTPARIVRLGAKTITSNNRGQYFAIWNWAAESGTWSVVARSSTTGGSSDSDPQTLEVK